MSTITIADLTITPTKVIDVSAAAETGNVIHRLIGGGRAYTLRPAAPRSGTLRLFFMDAEDAWECYIAHLAAAVAVLDDETHPQRSMSYITAGAVEPEVEPESNQRWYVSIAYAEVQA